jgi:uncharacterized RDD family membrane protein YckC
MNAVARFFLRAKHWQVFFLLAVTFLVGQAVAMSYIATTKLSSADPGKLSLLIGIVTTPTMLGWLGWLWSLGSFLISMVQPALRLKRGFFLFSIVYSLIYPLFFALSFPSTNPVLLAVILPLHLLVMFCMFYAFYFVSKTLVLAETCKPALFSDYVEVFFLIWLFPVGVWFIQPRINRLYGQPSPPPVGVGSADAPSLGAARTTEPAGQAHGIPAGTSPVYAGFWLRFAAALIDGLLTFFPLFFIAIVVIGVARIVSAARGYDSAVVILAVLPAVTIVAACLYFSILESSPWQATVGKLVLRLYVSDLEGHRITQSRAMCRNLAKCLSNLTVGTGYLMCGFTKKRQALHDILASCLVLRRPKY